MRFGKHRDVRPLFRVCAELGNQLFYLGIIHLFQRFFYRQRNRGIVNILRSQSEMDKLFIVVHTAQLVKFFFQEIFHSLHVVVSHAFNLLDASGIGFGKVTVDIS